MFPVITIFGKDIGTYAIMATFALLLCGFIFCYYVRKAGQDDNDAILFLLCVAGGIMVGGHILYALTNAKYFSYIFKCKDIKTLFAVLGYIFGGSVFYGGLIGGSIAGWVFAKLKKLDSVLYFDIFGVIAPLFHAFARIGCFLGGCCYGIECEFGFTAHGNELVPSLNDVQRFPVQLLESACNFLIFILIFTLFRKKKYTGRLFFIYLSVYAVVRFLDEFLRGDAHRGFVFGISVSQFISIFVELFAIAGLIYVTKLMRRKENIHLIKKS